VPLKVGGISISRHCDADQRSGDRRSPLKAAPHRAAAAAGRIRGGRGLPAPPQRSADKRQKMSFVLTVAAFPRVPRVPWANAVCCKRQKMSFVPTASVFIAVHPRSKCYNCVMQPQTVSVMKKCGTGVPPVDAPRCTFANRLTNITYGSATANHRYAYDCAGNLTNLISTTATNRFFYNAQNKLARIRGVGFTNEFVYDSQNRRVALCQNGTWRYEAHDGALPVGSFGQDRQVQNWCVRGVGIAEGTGDVMCEVDMSGAGAQPHYYLCNHRGDTLVVLNSSGTVTARMRYDAFGNMYDVSTNSVYFPRYTFSTKEYLSQPKLYLYAYRVYDPQAGRWTQRDPIDYQDSLNLYQFCGNNSINGFDTTGLIYLHIRVNLSLSLFSKAGVFGGFSLAYTKDEGFTFGVNGGTETAQLGQGGRNKTDFDIGGQASVGVGVSLGEGSYSQQMGEGFSWGGSAEFMHGGEVSFDGPGSCDATPNNPITSIIGYARGLTANYNLGLGAEVYKLDTDTKNGVALNSRSGFDAGALNDDFGKQK
jgi:RHS repeat-associated protein